MPVSWVNDDPFSAIANQHSRSLELSLSLIKSLPISTPRSQVEMQVASGSSTCQWCTEPDRLRYAMALCDQLQGSLVQSFISLCTIFLSIICSESLVSVSTRKRRAAI